jgi:hypothetical protein
VSGAAQFGKTIFVPASGAGVKLTRPTEGSPPKRTLGWIVAGVSSVAALTGLVWGSANAGQHPSAVDIVIPIGLLVGGLGGVFGGLALVDAGSSAGFDDAEVTPRTAAAARQVSRAFVPSLTFELE